MEGLGRLSRPSDARKLTLRRRLLTLLLQTDLCQAGQSTHKKRTRLELLSKVKKIVELGDGLPQDILKAIVALTERSNTTDV